MEISCVSSWKEWPIIWLVGLTHWNEIVWLDVFDSIKWLSLRIWEIILIPANIKAYEAHRDQKHFFTFRYIDHDLNHIWDDSFIPWSYEYQRLVPGQIIGYDWDRVIKNEYPFNVIYGIVAKYPEKWGSAWFLFTIKK